MKSQFTRLFAKAPIAAIVLLTAVLALIAGVNKKPEAPQPAVGGGSAVRVKSPFIRSLGDPSVGKVPFRFLDASVTTDKQDYSPGDVVQITGSGFYAGESVTLQITYVATSLKAPRTAFAAFDASGHDPWTVTADQNGNISSSWLVEIDSLGQTLLLTAIGQSSGLQAQHTFTDSVANDFNQCANDSGTLGLCTWLNGILNQNNSENFEGMSTLQRLIFPAVTTQPGNNHSVTFDDDFTKGGIHAYDFLTSWEQGIKAGADNGVPYQVLTAHTPVAGELPAINQTLDTTTACASAISATGQTICNALHNSTNVFNVPVPDDPFISHDGSLQTRINAYEAAYGQRYVRIYGNAPITAASFGTPVLPTPAHSVANGGDTSDSGTTYTLNWTSTSTQVLIEWGEHIALGGDGTGIGWGAGKGASSIQGGPYHVGMDKLDGATIGSQDNQLKGADVKPPPPQGTITIVKDSIPDDPQDFNFTADNGLTPGTFILDDDGGTDNTHSNTQTFTSVGNGTYHVTEGTEPAGWSLAKITCTDPNGGTTTSINSGGNGGTATIGVSAGESVTCIFTNVKPDAQISLTPGTATNEVGHAHTITATVTQNDQLPAGAPGDATTGFGPAPNGTLVTFSLPGGGATFVGGINTCTTSGGTGQCTVQINSSSAGTVTIHATTTFSVQNVSLTRATGDGLSGDSVDAKKTYVDAKISLTPPTATNEVGHAHTITATVLQDDGIPAGAPGDGATGFGPAPDGTTVQFSLPGGGATFVGASFCTVSGGAGQCSVQINSTSAGSVTIHATTTFNVGGLSLTRATSDGLSGDGSDVHKTYVDANIVLSPLTATNPVGVNHVITATVSQDDGIANPGGDGTNGFGPAPNGTTVNFSITNSLGATATFVGPSSCTTTGGTCTVTIVSPTAGHVVIHATTTFGVGGVSLTRASGDSHTGDSVDAQKDYVSGSLTLVKIVVNDNGGTATASSFGITTSAGTPVTFGTGVENPAHTFTYTSQTFSNLAPATYTLHENTLTGYSEGSWGCVGAAGTVVGNPQTGSVAVGANENVTCTITNNDIAPQLTLKKHVINDNGGTAAASAWTLVATGSGGFSGAGTPATGPDATNGPNNVTAGVLYSLSESGGPAGYTASSYSCVTNGGAPVIGNSITLGLGDSAVCTITNNDVAPTLRVIKYVIPSSDTGAFNLLIDGTVDASNVGNNGTTGFVAVNVGPHTVSEMAGLNTVLGSYSSTIGGDCASDGTITLALAQNATCTITNRRLPTLVVQKSIQGQSATFEFTATGTPINPTVGDIFITPPANGSSQSPSQIIQPGTYIVNEVNLPPNWMLTDFTCTSNNASGTFLFTPGTTGGSFVAGYGDNVTCSFVDDQRIGPTRTQGFWSTHTFLANAIWNGTPLPPGTSTITPNPVIGSPDAYLCQPPNPSAQPTPDPGVPITAIALPGQNQLMGGFWANIANTTVRTLKKRPDLDKARLQFLQQYLAAVLNVHTFGTPIQGTTLATARAAYCGTDLKAIQVQQGLLGTYNSSGDNQTFTPGSSATPNESRLEADIDFWDTTYHFADPIQAASGPTTTDGTRATSPPKPTPILNKILILPAVTDDPIDPDDPSVIPRTKKRGIE
jgi:hypothetical protein